MRALTALFLLAAGCSKDAVVVATAIDVTDAPAGSVVRTLAFGHKLRVKRWPGDPEAWLRIADGGFVRSSDVMLVPIQGTAQRYVIVHSTVALDGTTGKKGLKRFRPAAKVEVVATDALKTLIVDNGLPVGFVPTSDLSERPPAAKDFVERALADLQALDLAGVEKEAEAALSLAPAEPAALELLGQLLVDKNWKRSRTLLNERGALAPWPDVAKPVTPKEGDTLYVAATILKLRTNPDAMSKEKAEIPIATPIHVEERQGEWVRVTSPSRSLTVSLGSLQWDAPLSTTTASVAGWVHTRYLVGEPPDVATLTTAAARAREKNNDAEEALWRQRLLALEPTRSAQIAFVDAAVRSGHLAAAVDGAKTSVATTSGALVTIEAFFGCRGDVAKAETMRAELFDTLTPEAVTRTLGDDACLAAFDVHPPCEPAIDDEYAHDGDAASEAEHFSNDPAVQASREKIEIEERTAWLARAHAEWTKNVAEHNAHIGVLDELFSSSPKVRVRFLRPLTWAANKKAFLASIPYENVGACLPEYKVRHAAAQVSSLSLPELLPTSTLDVWIDIEDRGDIILAVLFAHDLDDARAQAQKLDVRLEGSALEDPITPAALLVLPEDHCAWQGCGC